MDEGCPISGSSHPVSTGGTVSGWLVAILIIVFAALYLQLSGLWPQPLFDPNSAPRAVTPRGDLAQDEQATINLFQAVNQSVVHITTSATVQNYRMDPRDVPLGSGSGFVWDKKGYIVTNYHVVRDAVRTSGRVRVVFYNSSSHPADVVGVNPAADLAVLKVAAAASSLKPIPIGTSSDLKVGQKVFAIGSPFSLDQSLTTGIVSGLGREIESPAGVRIKDVIQVSAPINPGNSGGPLLDSYGRLIGVNAAILSHTGEFSGVGFAIPVDTVNAVVPELIRSGTMEPPTLGVSPFRDDQIAILRRYGVVKEDGVLVAAVTPGGAAEEAGIQPTRENPDGSYEWGDLIIALDQTPIHDVRGIAQFLAGKRVGDRVKVTLLRDGKRMQLDLTLKSRAAVAAE